MFSDEEKAHICNHQELDDPIFLLSSKEYLMYKDAVKKFRSPWWLRSQSKQPLKVETVDDTDVVDYGVSRGIPVIRPAILLK